MILASFTMGTRLFLGFFFLYLTGVRSADDAKTHLVISNQIYTPQGSLDLTCQNACDETGEIIDCSLRASGKCLARYYLVCLGNRDGECKTINISCPDGSDSVEDMCENVSNAREDFRKSARKQNRRSMRSNTSGTKRLNNPNRRDLGGSDDALPLFSTRSGMVATSGNGHALVIDDDKIAQSHYGGPPVVSYYGGNIKDLMNFPFGWMSQKMKSGFEPSAVPNPTKEQDSYGQSQFSPYRSSGYGPSRGSDYGIYKYPPYYGSLNGYGPGNYPRSNPQSTFASVFNSVGLQDPMLMLQHLPIAIRTSLEKNPFPWEDSLDRFLGDVRMPDWLYWLPSAVTNSYQQ